MLFEKHDPTLWGGMFRPAKSIYGFDVSRQLDSEFVKRLVNFTDAIDILTAAFGDPIIFNEFQEVVEVDGYVEKNIPKDAWYLRHNTSYRQLFLTSDIQLSYLTMALSDAIIEVVIVTDAFRSESGRYYE